MLVAPGFLGPGLKSMSAVAAHGVPRAGGYRSGAGSISAPLSSPHLAVEAPGQKQREGLGNPEQKILRAYHNLLSTQLATTQLSGTYVWSTVGVERECPCPSGRGTSVTPWNPEAKKILYPKT